MQTFEAVSRQKLEKTGAEAQILAAGLPEAEGRSVWLWRHPLAQGAAGRCIGHTDLPVDPRKAKRVARRVQATARRHGLPRVVFTSDLARSRAVGRWLARWGWVHHVRADVRECSFGSWDGLPWAELPRAEVDAWAHHLAHVQPGGGESVAQLLARVAACLPTLPAKALLVTHGGWMCAAQWLHTQAWQAGAGPWPDARSWPRTPRNGECWVLAP
jgi:alpha-ribazole phosphatase